MKHHAKLTLVLLAALPACSAAVERHEEAAAASSEGLALAAPAASAGGAGSALGAPSACALSSPGGKVRHVIYVQFDNVHFTRDNPDIPSDLEQMPHLLQFMTANGALLRRHHTPLISHTADDIITALTGVYPENHGQAVANSYGYFNPPGASFFDGFQSSFTYWTDIVSPTNDPRYNLITQAGDNAPAPWVPYTRAGCNVGAVSIADMELENVSTDLTTVFGPGSPEVAEAAANRTLAIADFEGIAVHCAPGDGLCATGQTDALPQEPGGYTGYRALFGHKFVAPEISPNGPLTDLSGQPITDRSGNAGFPGFGGITAAQSLGYVAAMQEHGIPVTFAYISDAHDNHATGLASGPGQADYVARLATYDQAWATFFARLANDGITPANTLFVVTADEGDHFAGGPPSPVHCDGVTVPCTYAKIGEIDANMTSLLQKVDPALASTPFDIHFDMAPSFYVSGNPAPGAPIAREYERAAAKLTAVSPITGNTDALTRYLVDPVGMKLLHMITRDPQRTPTFVLFGDPDYFFQTSGPDVQENPGFAWNHGGVDPAINTTWLGLVGPGVRERGVDDATWSDHADIRPTMLLLTGLTDDYVHDGRALVEDLRLSALPESVRSGDGGLTFEILAAAYKQITAPVGALGKIGLRISTQALSGDDATYAALESQLDALTTARDALAAEIIARLENAEFHGTGLALFPSLELAARAEGLLFRARALAR